MSAKKGKQAEVQKQLSLPFGDLSGDRATAHQNPQSNIVSFQQRLHAKTAATQDNHRKKVIQQLLEHANSLNW